MRLEFTKLHGLGNDFAVFDARRLDLPWRGELAKRLCDRHTGIGADGILLFTGTPEAPAMTVINADGSVPEMCGNGLRCMVRWLCDRFGLAGDRMAVQTGAGLIDCAVQRDGRGHVQSVALALGPATYAPSDVPVLADAPLIDAPFAVAGKSVAITALAIGNPHAVTFDPLTAALRRKLGPLLSRHPRFVRQTNVEFVALGYGNGGPHLRVHVFERGCGWTQACGTGATAAVIAAARLGHVGYDENVAVELPGGLLHVVARRDGSATLSGPAVAVFAGSVDVAPLLADAA